MLDACNGGRPDGAALVASRAGGGRGRRGRPTHGMLPSPSTTSTGALTRACRWCGIRRRREVIESRRVSSTRDGTPDAGAVAIAR